MSDRSKHLQEALIMQRLNHPNIIRLEHYFYTRTRYFLVMELATGEELFHSINRKKKEANKFRLKFTPSQIRWIMRDLLSAVSTMHYNGIIHRDIKFENIKF